MIFYKCEGNFRSPYASWILSLGYWVGQSDEENTPLRDRDHLRSDPMSSPVFWISVSGRSLNSYGTSPNLWVQKELVKFRQGTQDTWLRFAKFLREFLGYPPLNLLGDLGDVILGNSGSSTFCPLLLLLPSGVSLETAANFLLFLNVAILLEGKSCQWLILILSFLVLIKVSSKSEGIKFQQFKQSKKVILKRVTILKIAIF